MASVAALVCFAFADSGEEKALAGPAPLTHFIVAANTADSRATGLGRQMHGVAGALSTRGHQVELLFAESLKLRSPRRLSRIKFPLALARHVGMVRKRTREPIVCIFHEPTAWATALRARWLELVTTVAMVHNCEPKCWRILLETSAATGKEIPLRSRISWPLTELTKSWLSLKLADHVLCLSSEDRRYLHHQVGLPEERVTRIDNGLEGAFLGLPSPGEPRARDILFMASWLPHKGTRQFSEALLTLWYHGVRPRVTIAGTGVGAKAVLADIPERCREETEVIDYVAPTRLIELYRSHRILVLPSITEGIPLSLLEGMACGLCPVATNVGGIPDVVTHGRDGILLPPLEPATLANTLLRLLEANDEVTRMAREAHRRVQGHSWARVAAQIENALAC